MLKSLARGEFRKPDEVLSHLMSSPSRNFLKRLRISDFLWSHCTLQTNLFYHTLVQNKILTSRRTPQICQKIWEQIRDVVQNYQIRDDFEDVAHNHHNW